MTPPATTLPELVEQLGRTFSPFERLKILSRAWSLLRTMPPHQRLSVAARLGLDKADEVVEAIATHTGGQPSPALLAMIEQAQVKGTAHLPELISDLRDPKRRTARLKEEAAAALAGGEVPAATWLPPGAAPPAAPGTPRPAAPSPATAKPPAPQPVATPPPAPAPPVAPPVAAPAPAPPPVAKAAPPAPAPTPPVAQAAPAPEPRPVQAAPPPKPQPKPQPAPAPVRTAAIQTTTDNGLADRLAAISTLTLRFRVFRRSLDEAKGMSTAGLRSILDGFPDGWARRRAILELLRAGIPAALPDALSLVEALGSERDRLWCLGALTDAREIPAADREVLLMAATSPTARRRLEGRLGKG
jgi:outer membrane biosynthesis protein TonB